MSYKLNELKQLVHEAKHESEWEKFLTRIKQSYLLESPLFLKEAKIHANRYPFKAIFVLGPAGAGKSFLSSNLGIPEDFKVSNPDEHIEEVFPAFGISMKYVGKKEAADDSTGTQMKKMNIQQLSRSTMSNAVGRITANYLMIANPLVFDTTGENPAKIIPRMENLVRLGYDVGVFQINVPTDVSVQRDKDRPRTVGDPTHMISTDYQQNVVQDKAYLNLALQHKQEPVEQEDPLTGEMIKVDKSLIRTFGDAVYPNLYNVETGELLQGITQDHVDAIAPGFTPQDAKAILDKARADIATWLNSSQYDSGSEPYNPTGKAILAGMKAMVETTGGKYGQNMNHLSFAGAVVMEFPEIKDSLAIMTAIKTLEELAGEDRTIQDAVTIGHMKVLKDPFLKDIGDQTVRDASGSDVGNRSKLRNIRWEKERAAEIEKVKQGIGRYKDLSPEEKEREISKLHSKKKQDKDKYEERLSKESIYKIVKKAIKS